MNNDNKKKLFDIKITLNKNLQNNSTSYEVLAKLNNILKNTSNKSVLLDFKNTDFIAGNLFALLGGILDTNVKKNNLSIKLINLHAKTIDLIKKNGLGTFFHLDTLKDTYNTTIKYKAFHANTEQLQDFERYMILIMSRQELPFMDNKVKNCITDYFLEIFNNVIDHGNCKDVYVCGQFFYKSKTLSFSIVDFGNTIKKNVIDYFNKKKQPLPINSLEWAIKPGNSTKTTNAPGGLGFGILHKFLIENKGSFILISADEIYELNRGKVRFSNLENHFTGTIVTITINLSDDFAYLLNEQTSELIVF